MKRPEHGFGMHLLVDGYGCDRQRLEDLSLIYTFLSEYPAQIQMTKIMPPYVFRYDAKNKDDWGISGFVLIAESHISIHTFVEPHYVNIDVFSCKSFNAEQVIKDLSDRLQLTEVRTQLFDRNMTSPSYLDGMDEIALLKPQ